MSFFPLVLALFLGLPLPLAPGSAPAVVQTDAGALLAWLDNSLKTTLAGTGRITTLLDHNPAAFALATHGPESLAVWADGAKLTAIRLDGRGVPIGEPFTVANTTTTQVAVAADGERYVIAWPGLFGDIWALVIDRDGGIVLPPMPVTTQSTDTPSSLRVASNGESFLITWNAGRRVFAQLVDDNGVPRMFLPMLVTNPGGSPDVASNGRDFFVVWHRAPNPGLGAAEVSADGEVGDELQLTTGTDGEPRVTWDGYAYAVAYNTLVRFGSREVPQMIVARFGANGYLLESASTGALGEKSIAARNGRIALSYVEVSTVMVT